MSQVEDNAMLVIALFTLVFPLLFMGSAYVLPLISMLDLDTAPTVNDTISQNIDENWSNGSIDGLETDGDIIYPDTGMTGIWTSQLYDVPRNRVLSAEYGADMRDGNGTLTVRAWNDDASGSPDEVKTFDLSSGENVEDVGFSEYSYFEVEIELTNTATNNNQRPNVDYVNLEFEIVNQDQIGLSSDQSTTLLFLVYVFGLMLFLFSMYYSISFVVKD